MALWALGFFFAVDQRFKRVMALLADVFVDGHKVCSIPRFRVSRHSREGCVY
jgi:hypothetical protein